jgi:predicted AAA+ superfamily ATPase
MKLFKRHISELLLKLANEYPVIVVYGPRQIGKTTLLEETFAKSSYAKSLTFDDKNVKDLALQDPKTFLNIYSPPLFIDEFQKAPEILETIKLYVDKNKKTKMFFLSGSDILPILKATETMSTRMCLIPMLSLSQSEIDERDN